MVGGDVGAVSVTEKFKVKVGVHQGSPLRRSKRGFVAVVKEDIKVVGARKEDTVDRDGENWFHCGDC